LANLDGVLSSSFHTIPNILKNLRSLVCLQVLFSSGPTLDKRHGDWVTFGPKDFTGEPLGGSSYGFFSTEYTFDIVSGIRIALFYDAGFVNTDAYDFNPGGYNDNYGFSFRFFLAGAPVSLDYGIPLTQDAGFEVGPQFNFSFGTRY